MVRKKATEALLSLLCVYLYLKKVWSVRRVNVNEWKCEEKTSNRSLLRERERERERKQNLVHMLNSNHKDLKNRIWKAQNVSPQIVCRTAWLHTGLNSSTKVRAPSGKGCLCTWYTELYRTLYTPAERRVSFFPRTEQTELEGWRFSRTHVVLISLFEM